MSATMFDALFNGHALPTLTETFGETAICWEAGQERVTAVQLKNGRSFDGIFAHTTSEKDAKFGIANILKGNLWLPISAKPAQQEQWLLIMSDNSQTEVTVCSFGVRSGGLQQVMVEQVTVSRFGATSFGGK